MSTAEQLDFATDIDPPFLNCKLPLRDVYEGIEFTPTCVQAPETTYEVK